MEWLINAIRECSRAARSDGVSLALEPINHYETTLINEAAQGLELIKSVGEDNFGLLLDTFHMNIEEAIIERVHPAVRKTHLPFPCCRFKSMASWRGSSGFQINLGIVIQYRLHRLDFR